MRVLRMHLEAECGSQAWMESQGLRPPRWRLGATKAMIQPCLWGIAGSGDDRGLRYGFGTCTIGIGCGK